MYDAGSAFRLDGSVALVTGSRRGIGLGLARGLALAGAEVVLNARDEGSLLEAAAALRAELEAGGCASPVHTRAFDVTAEQPVAAAVAGIEDDIGPLGILVNNAGIQVRGPLTEIALTDWEKVVATDLTSAFVVGREVARRMLPRGRGKIVNVCSVQTRLVRATTAPYAAAKGGLANLTQAMCAEWAAAGIQANGLAPGYIRDRPERLAGRRPRVQQLDHRGVRRPAAGAPSRTSSVPRSGCARRPRTSSTGRSSTSTAASPQ